MAQSVAQAGGPRRIAPCCQLQDHALITMEDMEQVAKPDLLEVRDIPDCKRPLVFLDTNVIVGYLHGEPSAVQLFSAEGEGRIRFAVNAIVFQELLLCAEAPGQPELERIQDHFRLLPIDVTKAEALLPLVRGLRNRLVHSNDILIVSSAAECDFLVTRDALLKSLVTAEKPRVVTPEELVTQLRAASSARLLRYWSVHRLSQRQRERERTAEIVRATRTSARRDRG